MLRLYAQKTESLKSFTENNYAQGSFYWNYLLKNKEIRVNGKRVSGDVLLESGAEVIYFLTKKQEEKPAFYTVFEDENFLIVDKESGVNSEAVFAELCRRGEYCFIHSLRKIKKRSLLFYRRLKKNAWKNAIMPCVLENFLNSRKPFAPI